MTKLEQIFEIVLNPMTQVFVPLRPMGEAEQAEALAQYAAVLMGFSESALRRGWESVRATHVYRNWPTPATIADSCGDAESALTPPKARHEQGRVINGEWQPWSGHCQCDRCVMKPASHGFYRASNADHQRDAATRRELDDFMWQKMYGPGTPPVPAFTGEEIQITAERARAVIEATAKRLNYDGRDMSLHGPETRKMPAPRHSEAELAQLRRDALAKKGIEI